MRLNRVALLMFIVAALVLLSSSGPAQGQGTGPVFVPNEVIVQFRYDVGPGEQARARGLVNGARAELLRRGNAAEGTGDLELMRIPPGLAIADARRELANDAAVEFSEPNWIYQHFADSNDPYYTNGSLWGMYGAGVPTPTNQFGSHAEVAWANEHTDCSSVYVGIIDEGYMYSHEDLAANAGKNPGEVAGNGADDDGNGYVDDVYGWDFAGNNNTVFDGTADDHGTHVAGTIGAVGNNGTGVAGVCWKVKLLNAKFLGNAGGTTANAIKAVDYFTDLKTRHNLNLVATNNSWGGGGFSQALQDAISRANTANILFVAAAGNSAVNCDSGSSCYPAEYPNENIISVASITSTGALSSFSNFGATTVDIGAPGSGIVSTVPQGRGKNNIVSGYASYSGTSMATPHVTGAAALYAAYHAGASAVQIKDAILNGLTTPSLSGKTVTGDRLNVSTF